MGSLRGHHAHHFLDDYDPLDDPHQRFERQPNRTNRPDKQPGTQDAPQALRRHQPSASFKCHKCKAFIGMPLTGGRHRNHCPACLWSLHVDRKTPGDRASQCRSLMEPVAIMARRSGEQAVVHRCRGCGVERHCRIAADDNPLLLIRLPPVAPEITAPFTDGNRAGAA